MGHSLTSMSSAWLMGFGERSEFAAVAICDGRYCQAPPDTVPAALRGVLADGNYCSREEGLSLTSLFQQTA